MGRLRTNPPASGPPCRWAAGAFPLHHDPKGPGLEQTAHPAGAVAQQSDASGPQRGPRHKAAHNQKVIPGLSFFVLLSPPPPAVEMEQSAAEVACTHDGGVSPAPPQGFEGVRLHGAGKGDQNGGRHIPPACGETAGGKNEGDFRQKHQLPPVEPSPHRPSVSHPFREPHPYRKGPNRSQPPQSQRPLSLYGEQGGEDQVTTLAIGQDLVPGEKAVSLQRPPCQGQEGPHREAVRHLKLFFHPFVPLSCLRPSLRGSIVKGKEDVKHIFRITAIPV